VTYIFPDVAAGLAEVLDDLGEVSYILPEDWTPVDGPRLHLYRVGGSVSGIERVDRVVLDVYAGGLSAAYGTAGAAQTRIDGRSHATSAGLLDSVVTEVVPTAVPTESSEHVSLVRATYRVATRPLPA